ncbi:MAG: CHASE2 domain-containing protein [Gammaproteobacteria bacterium]|nr:CHASE2 domain-containing protein [Gammaproteobacteria bacterium]
MKSRFWSSDWFAGLLITIVIVVFSGSAPFQSLERSFYDWGVRSTDRVPSDKVAVIAIDDQSIDNLGRWPWPRNLHAELINRLNEGGAKVIGQTVFFLEPQIDPGMLYIRDLIEFFSNASFNDVPADIDAIGAMLEFEGDNKDILEFYMQSSVNTRLSQDIETLKANLFEAEQDLNTDAKLAQSLADAKNVVLAMVFYLGSPRGNPDTELPDYVLQNSINQIRDRISAQSNGLFPIPTIDALPPIADIGRHAAAIGHLNTLPDIDGGVRSEPLVLQHYDRFYPSISLQIAAKSLNLDNNDIRVNLAESVELGSLIIKTDTQLQMNTFFYSDINGPAFQIDSYYDVFTGKIPIEKYKGKIVLIGPTATGVGTPQVTPINSAMAPVLTLAHSVSSILNEDFFIEPEWGFWARMGTFLVVMLYLMLVMPRLKAGAAFVVTIVLVLGLVAAHYVLMTSNTMWIQLMTPGALLAIGYLLITTKRFLVTERGKARSDEESAESNRMLGIAFQTQGQLDMAFEKFRKCSPVDEQVLEAMYNLALDFERKRQFSKATSTYQYMAKHDKSFRDIDTRMDRSQKMEEAVLLGGSGGHAGGTLMLDGGGIEKPMLGRYEVEKELGKGAMGIVYLGKDPKINRVVAIKTMALAQEFEEDELEEVKERFFREAETAGRLNHANIVTIFDAGEEHDLAYIAMEFLKGHDLARYCKPDNLMDMKTVISIVLRSAEGLDFAHQQNVVHRDIKPANIMYEPESDTVKITDFGIARITDSSKTKTGMVLGTPSYMSPEQLAGKKVDGRSDLFSLGVMLYQMLCGSLPFKAESMASLMFKITNEEAPDIRTMRADIPEAMANIINRALTKNADERYQTGAELANALKTFMQT